MELKSGKVIRFPIGETGLESLISEEFKNGYLVYILHDDKWEAVERFR